MLIRAEGALNFEHLNARRAFERDAVVIEPFERAKHF